MENSQKIDTALNMSLDVTAEERERSRQLSVGYNWSSGLWRVIVKYAGDLDRVREAIPDSQVIRLFGQFGIVRLAADQIDVLAGLPEILYIEKPKQLYYSLDTGRSISCINSVQGIPGSTAAGTGLRLTGQGVLVGIVDSGIDFTHPAFRGQDGKSRILFLWDQTGRYRAAEDGEYATPEGYSAGTEWTGEQLDQVMDGTRSAGQLPQGVKIPSDTAGGHGTAVAGVAAGNGAGSAGGRYRGIATESPLIVVKLGAGKEGFLRTTEVMEGLDYIVRKAIALNMPVSVNLSFGNNYGAHNGQSLFEEYISALADIWKSVITVASGNEGESRHHAEIHLRENAEVEEIPFVIGANERNISLQIWKEYADNIAIFIEAPDGGRKQVEALKGEVRRYRLGGNEVLAYYGEPSPYAASQEIYLEWIVQGENPLGEILQGENISRAGGFLAEGIWRILLIPERIVSGRLDLWLPVSETVGQSTGFLNPSPDTTLTIPSTAWNVITVGAYREDNDTVAAFSGRGDTADGRNMPTLVAPGVNVMTAAPGGGYSSRTGTSFAAPFVSGSAALLMEWGIIRGNDPYLYGAKVRAYLIKGARRLAFQNSVPEPVAGWGALCLRDSFPGGDF